MKRFVILLVLMVGIATIFAQSPVADRGAMLNAGFGLSGWGVPVYAGLDFGLGRDVTLGAEVSYRSWDENYQSGHYNHAVIGISGNLNYHLNYILQIPYNWDFYGGVNVGYYVFRNPDNYPGTYKSQLGISGQVGGRYFFTNSLGINLEFGGGNAFSGGKLGITAKL